MDISNNFLYSRYFKQIFKKGALLKNKKINLFILYLCKKFDSIIYYIEGGNEELK